MIFTGDVAIADGDIFEFVGFPESVSSTPMCINLEGAIKATGDAFHTGVYNSEKGISEFSEFNLKAAFLANNHIHDLREGVVNTCNYFSGKGIQTIGAGNTIEMAQRPGLFQAGDYKYVVFGFGWPVIGCLSCTETQPGVNEFNRDNVLSSVSSALETKKTRIVIVIHGNYEFEPYPQPAHRELARELIDLGVYSVIFHHPHIVGPIERHNGRTIAYSLGNFAFSQNKFFSGKLAFPERSFHQILIELGDEDVVHHCNFEPPTFVSYHKSEPVHSPDLSLKAEFEGFTADEYLIWFKAHRHKNKLLPIYKHTDSSVSIKIKDRVVHLRQKLIEIAVSLRFKGLKRK